MVYSRLLISVVISLILSESAAPNEAQWYSETTNVEKG